MVALADEIKRRTFAVGHGFQPGDTSPLNECYDPLTGIGLRVEQFSWTAAHLLMWAQEARQQELLAQL
jgi:hypothetical protein